MAHSFTLPTPALGRAALATLSEGQRAQVLLNLHGQGESVEENSEFNQNALERLNDELRSIQDKEAFELAQLHCPDYVNSSDHRLMFLRSTMFDVKGAAAKIVQYWTKKVGLFGPDRAFRNLSIQDLHERDETGLTRGGLKALPVLDQAGRGVLYSTRHLWDNRNTHRDSMLRVFWYMVHSLLDEVDVQRNGIVFIFWNNMPPHSLNAYDTKLTRLGWRHLFEGLPIRVQGLHQAIEHKNTHIQKLQQCCAFADSLSRSLWIEHYVPIKGLAMELEEYGFSGNELPPEAGGTLDFDYQQWLDERRRNDL